MKRDPLLYLDDIIESAEAILKYTEGMNQKDFNANGLVQDAVIRRLEIIGEAVARLPSEIKDTYPDIPWPDIAGMRNKLIHEYFGVLLERVWAVIQDDLPKLRDQAKQIRSTLQTDTRPNGR